MNIDVNALQQLPEIPSSAGLKGPIKTCEGKSSTYGCLRPTCIDTKIKRTIIYDR